MGRPEVLLGMSGGTDSSVAAMLLQEQGYDVTGLTLWLYDQYKHPGQPPEFIAAAQELARTLSIPHHLVDARHEFKELVINAFADDYFSGLTPFPCTVCNPKIKWKIMSDVADRLGINYLATGHYLRMEQANNRPYLAAGLDQDKDQSFFLWNLSPDLLPRILFPLGAMTKDQVRQYARDKGFPSIASRRDSLGICFLPDGDYHPFLDQEANRRGWNFNGGELVDHQGHCMGLHKGFYHYTIGQRRGLEHGQNKALFVTGIFPGTNQVRLGDFSELKCNSLELRDTCLYYPDDPDPLKVFTVKVRYRKQLTPCHAYIQPGNRMILELLEPLYSVAPGQSAVLYESDRVIGGGIIVK